MPPELLISRPVPKSAASRATGGTAGAERLSAGSTQALALMTATVAISLHAAGSADGDYRWVTWAWLGALVLALWVLAGLFRRHAAASQKAVAIAPLLTLAVLLTPLCIWLGGEGLSFLNAYEVLQTVQGDLRDDQLLAVRRPIEITLLTTIRNLTFVLGVFSVWPRSQRLAVGLSLFLVTFTVSVGWGSGLVWLLAAFVFAAAGWLFAAHWESVDQRLVKRQRPTGVRSLAVVLPLLLALLSGVFLLLPTDKAVRALGGWMPSSGGTDQADPRARDGLGDGEMLVAGTDQVQSFAPIEDAPFKQDDEPSLYDLHDDGYGEEIKVKRTDRGIPLPPELASRAREHVDKRTEKAHREFSTVRQQQQISAREVDNIRSKALFYVAGRVPLHLRLELYDLFDGDVWYPEEEPRTATTQPLEIVSSANKPWLQLPDRGRARDYLGAAETHALKIVGLDSTVIPAPLYLHGIHIDRVDQADMFRHGPEGLVAMNRSALPTLVPIHLASRPINPDALRANPVPRKRGTTRSSHHVIPDTFDRDRWRRTAEEWSAGEAEGWGQIAAIAAHLQRAFQHDPGWRPSSTDRPGVEQFLFEAGRGPDYQFATAAALLLRSLGYGTRVVSGFYASAERYDHASRHTPVLGEDVHFWVEVNLGGPDWVPLEATPGFRVLGPQPGLFRQFATMLGDFGRFLGRQWLAVTGLTLLLFASLARRRQLADLFLTAWWRGRLWWRPQHCLPATLQLLQGRAGLAGARPRRGVTYRSWFEDLFSRCDSIQQRQLLSRLQQAIDEAAYGRPRAMPLPDGQLLCQEASALCTLNWFQFKSPTPSPFRNLESPGRGERAEPARG